MNLLLLADAKLVVFDDIAKKKLKEWSEGKGGIAPGLPVAGPSLRSDPIDQKAYAKIRNDVAFAVSVLNKLFKRTERPPGVQPSDFGAFAEPQARLVHLPPQAQDCPDITYREVAHFYRPIWGEQREAVALGFSVADVLAAIVSQQRLGQTERTSDWILFRQWTPRSLKAPRIDHLSKFLKNGDEFEGVADNSGIPSKAFYEAAMKLGTDKAADVWVNSLSKFRDSEPTFSRFASETANQARILNGNAGAEDIIAAWKSVGVIQAK